MDDGHRIVGGDRLHAVCRAVSVVTHPWVLFTCLTAVVLFGDTMMLAIPDYIRLFFLGIVIMDTALLPAAFVLLLRRLGLLSPAGVFRRRELLVTVAVTLLCYVVALLMVRNILMAFMIRHLLVVAVATAAVSLAIGAFWNISLHLVAWGGVVAALGMFTVSGVGDIMWVLLAAIVLCGVTASARIHMRAATPAQAAVGFLVGVAVALSVFWLVLR